MNNQIRMHDAVALLEDIQARHFVTDRPLLLRRGQMGSVVMEYDGRVLEVEFAGRDGKTYALLPIEPAKLMVLRDAPEYAIA